MDFYRLLIFKDKIEKNYCQKVKKDYTISSKRKE